MAGQPCHTWPELSRPTRHVESRTLCRDAMSEIPLSRNGNQSSFQTILPDNDLQ